MVRRRRSTAEHTAATVALRDAVGPRARQRRLTRLERGFTRALVEEAKRQAVAELLRTVTTWLRELMKDRTTDPETGSLLRRRRRPIVVTERLAIVHVLPRVPVEGRRRVKTELAKKTLCGINAEEKKVSATESRNGVTCKRCRRSPEFLWGRKRDDPGVGRAG